MPQGVGGLQIRTVGANGQITLGTSYAGQAVAIEEIEPGVWMVKLGDFVPRSERWLHEPDVRQSLDRALAWADTHPPEESDLKLLEDRLNHDQNPS